MLLVTWLRYELKVPQGRVPEVLEKMLGLRISEGEVQNILDQLASAYGPFYESLLMDLRSRMNRGVDESTWRTNGDNGYAWAFVSKWEAIFLLGQTRSHEVPLAILGKDAKGTITTDGFSAYKTLLRKTQLHQQRCWSHILADAKELSEFYPEEAPPLLEGLKKIYACAAACKGHGTPADVAALTEALHTLLDRSFKSHKCATFARNTRAAAPQLFCFVTDPEVEGTNNRTERAIRGGIVTARKVSAGSRSESGAKTRGVLTSVLQSLRLRGLDILKGAGLNGPGPPPASIG